MSDILWRGTAFNDRFRILAVRSTDTVQTARDLHDLSPLATILMGQMLSAAALLSLDLKSPEADVTIKIKGNGHLGGGTVICTATGAVRGYVENPRLFFDDPGLNYAIAPSLGDGTLSVIRSVPSKSPWMGTIGLVGGEVAQNLAQYFLVSEQVPSMVNLGVLIDRDARIKAAGGFVIQQLPNADPHLADVLMERADATPNLSDLMDMGMDIPDILKRFLIKEQDMSLEQTHPLQYRCNCSRDRFRAALKLLGRDDLLSMTEGIEPECHFCAKRYHFPPQEIQDMVSELDGQ